MLFKTNEELMNHVFLDEENFIKRIQVMFTIENLGQTFGVGRGEYWTLDELGQEEGVWSEYNDWRSDAVKAVERLKRDKTEFTLKNADEAWTTLVREKNTVKK